MVTPSRCQPWRPVWPALAVGRSSDGRDSYTVELHAGSGVARLSLDEARQLGRDLPRELTYLLCVAEVLGDVDRVVRRS